MKACITMMIAGLAATVALAEPQTGRDGFAGRQALEEVQRVAGQMDVLQSNFEAVSERLARIEGGKGEIAALKADIDSLRAEIAQLRREMQNQRGEIVKDLGRRIETVQRQSAAPALAPQPARRAGSTLEYTVQGGDTLSLIAQAFGTKVGVIKEMNGLKSDNLRIGQKLVVPKK